MQSLKRVKKRKSSAVTKIHILKAKDRPTYHKSNDTSLNTLPLETAFDVLMCAHNRPQNIPHTEDIPSKDLNNTSTNQRPFLSLKYCIQGLIYVFGKYSTMLFQHRKWTLHAACGGNYLLGKFGVVLLEFLFFWVESSDTSSDLENEKSSQLLPYNVLIINSRQTEFSRWHTALSWLEVLC